MVQTLRQVMTSDIVCCSPNQTLKEAAELMSRHNIGSIPVINNGKLEGIITDRDITLRSAARGKDDDKVAVADCMTSNNLISGRPDMDVHEAARLMSEKQIRRLPVVENDRVVGIVSLGDLATENQLKDEAEKALSGISRTNAD
ncbi:MULTISPECIES: CBS domain-containing protein [unclassified Sporolactobacillus]|uniref:CBS domain-containing protein n=1 Tax=unclassified Sporolactobacillus TaxID=2628533 RepID=UPI0023684E9F|nr:CBS domain-containing protein [Sporolactobacillus sp. CQH2019]MDD9147464.1 CBS domain-containing protein [Sporolactobacillus sp. CQH2019]